MELNGVLTCAGSSPEVVHTSATEPEPGAFSKKNTRQCRSIVRDKDQNKERKVKAWRLYFPDLNDTCKYNRQHSHAVLEVAAGAAAVRATRVHVPSGLVGGPCPYEARSISWVLVSPSAYSQVLFLAQKLMSGKRESVSQQHSMKIDEQWER